MTTDVTPQLKLTIIKHLAGGKTAEVVAAIVGIPRDRVVDIASHHGYPDTEKLAWAADILAKNIDDEAKGTITERPDLAPRITRPQTAGAATSTPAAPAPLTKPDELRILLNTAKAHPSKRIQAAADRAFDQLDRIRTLIHEDEEKNADKRRIAAEKAAARAEVEHLEEQLRAARAKLRDKTTTPPSTQPRPTTAPKGEHPCRNEGCERVFDTGQGRSLHERMKCEHRVAAAS